MTTADLIAVCPYTGLRSFTEEESLYFKGRDLQIDQITALLEKNKFLMVTGASGEGKSSLIYAGLVPNARAGFFRASYTNWIVADFRPERTPVKNMAEAIAEKFDVSAVPVETELRRGYSALIDLYTNSPFYVAEAELKATGISDTEIRDRKRKAANLLIVVDQFEEFFTNPENFYHEVPSRDSQIVVNLVLETARIAMARNLPVYVVCTMRSDYIGQCSAFRGLPEYIGFSQFFVPRLKRKDLKQVIEEPALLAGLQVSQRLIERLVFDIAEGVDQLPILQHALSRIWMAADHGREELDLVHYAMVGGMPAADLPDEDLARFNNWFSSLPEKQRTFYQTTGLDKVIEIHANQLYETAWDYYEEQHPGTSLSRQDAKRIIALAFSCLTKIDNSRAVRNRMSLAEITAIINNPALDTTVVGGILNIFREEGNSFIRPFRTDDPSTHTLQPETVLDITHESLIRNWNKLILWADKEFEFYTTFLDFQKQLNRWKKSGKSRGYLLPVGPLSYFEHWYNQSKPNEGWIMRYAEVREDRQHAVQHARETLSDTREFLRRSASKEAVTRTIMKYGPRKLGTIFAILVMLVLSGYYWYNADQKKNANVLERVKKESEPLLQSKQVSVETKGIYLISLERSEPGSLMPYLQSLPLQKRLPLGNELYQLTQNISKQEQTPIKKGLFSLLVRGLDTAFRQVEPATALTETNKFLILANADQYYAPDEQKSAAIDSVSQNAYQLAIRFFQHTGLYRSSISSELNMAIQLWLARGKASADDLRQLIRAISPRAGDSAAASFNRYYAKGNGESDGRQTLDFNGGYHLLACLYAALGDTEQLLWVFQQMLLTNQRDYFEVPRLLNNHLNAVGYLYSYGHRNEVPAVLHWIATNTADNEPKTVLRNVVMRSGYISHFYHINIDRGYYRSNRGFLHPNLFLAPRPVFDAISDDYEKEIGASKDPKTRLFELAMNAKRKVMFYSKYWYDRRMPMDSSRLDAWLNTCIQNFNALDSQYLQGTESTTVVYNGDGVRTFPSKRRNMLIYPDYRDGWFAWAYHDDYFFNYLRRHQLMKLFYQSAEDLDQLHLWVARAYEWKTEVSPRSYSNPYPLPDAALTSILEVVDQNPQGKSFDRNLICMILANHAFDRNDTVSGMRFFSQVDQSRLVRSSNRYEYLEKIFFLNMATELAVNLAGAGKIAASMALAERFPEEAQRALVYNRMAQKLYLDHADPYSFVLLDSSLSNSRRIPVSDYPVIGFGGLGQLMLLSEIGSKPLNAEADNILRNLPEGLKFPGIIFRIWGISREGNYYRALTSMPATLTENEELTCRTTIIWAAAVEKDKANGDERWKYLDEYLNWFPNFINYVPN